MVSKIIEAIENDLNVESKINLYKTIRDNKIYIYSDNKLIKYILNKIDRWKLKIKPHRDKYYIRSKIYKIKYLVTILSFLIVEGLITKYQNISIVKILIKKGINENILGVLIQAINSCRKKSLLDQCVRHIRNFRDKFKDREIIELNRDLRKYFII